MPISHVAYWDVSTMKGGTTSAVLPHYPQSLSHAWCIVGAQWTLQWMDEWIPAKSPRDVGSHSLKNQHGKIRPPPITGPGRRCVCLCVSVWVRACVHTCSSSLPQIELLINRPAPTWQRLRFSTTVLIISPILLIWQNPKIKQSSTTPPHLPLSMSLEPGALLEQWVPHVWDVSPEPANLPFLPPITPALDLAFCLACPWT